MFHVSKLPDPDRGAPRGLCPSCMDGRCDAVDRETARRCLRRQHQGPHHRWPEVVP
jgi:hypothetical protein